MAEIRVSKHLSEQSHENPGSIKSIAAFRGAYIQKLKQRLREKELPWHLSRQRLRTAASRRAAAQRLLAAAAVCMPHVWRLRSLWEPKQPGRYHSCQGASSCVLPQLVTQLLFLSFIP